MRVLRHSVLAARPTKIALAACGMIAGYLLSYVLGLYLAQNTLDANSKLLAVEQAESSKEARNLLSLIKKSPYPSCSDAEINYFRTLVFRSEYLKDVGRIHSGRIDCSATAGRQEHSIRQFKSHKPLSDGTVAYSNLVPIPDSSVKRAGLQLGTGYVVFGSRNSVSAGLIPMHFTISMNDAAAPQTGPPATADPQEGGLDLTTEGKLHIGDNLYATRCSTKYFTCVTTSTSVPEAVRAELGTLVGGTLFGGVAGYMLCVAFASYLRRRQTLEQQLRRAIARNRISVAYQPIVNLATGRIVGAEALARWTNEEGEVIGPDVFIKIAQERGFIGELTRLVTRRALQDFAETMRTRSGFRLSVNVTAEDLVDPKYLPMLYDATVRAKIQPKSVALEITENSTVSREAAMETVRLLRRAGYSIHIDDFGTGYSSLSYLLYLSVDTIKVDKAFTQAIGTDSVTVAILPQIMAMAKSLNLEMVVEGIETDQQANYFSLARQPILGQGYLYGRPVSAEVFHGQLAENWEKALVPADTDALRKTRNKKKEPLHVVPARVAF
jgi:sensor c-di-GMP phosphodiesterase-like protein